jgi:cytidylate kinase
VSALCIFLHCRPEPQKELFMLTHAPALDRIGQALERAEHHWHERHHQPQKASTPAFTIALSREVGTPGTSVAHEVGQRLGWTVYDHELVEHIAQQMGVHASLLDSIDERGRNWLMQCLEAFGPSLVPESAYTRRLTETFLSLAAHGHCVIVGRGAANVMPPQTTLRVRLIGNLEDRIAWVSQQRRLTRAKASEWINTTQRERLAFVRKHFFMDAADQHHYHLVLNTSLWTVQQCAELIIDALHRAEQSTNAA